MKCPVTEKQRNIALILKNGGPQKRTKPSKIMEQILLAAVPRHMVDREVIRVSQLGYTYGKLCQANLVAIYNRVTVLLDKAGATVSPQTSVDL